ncbi:4-oxalomesaconate tautomerase [Ramlibacter sp.]|uniref:4-oxalomesaconate tautomerase n=1 Tax=Ramlibacter sp. TaxID=1917967 RepID=UPI0035B4D3F5
MDDDAVPRKNARIDSVPEAMKTTLPCVLMRAGSSRGPFFLREWLPAADEARDQALIGAIGASDPLQLDGLGGGSSLTCKVAMVSRSSQPDCDVDYLFAQVGVGQRSVDVRPNCGNMLSGVVPFAIEQGLIAAGPETTTARVYNVNTRSRIDVTVQTPGGHVTYEGDARIDGVPGTAAPILLNFLDAWGSVTGSVFPTGQRIDVIDGVQVTCIDAAMPMMLVRAQDLGVTGREKPVALDANAPLLERLEALRVEAGRRMGLGDVRDSVIPKPVLVSEGEGPDSITSRYFTPRKCHASHAVTGAIGVTTAFALPGTVASGGGFAPGRHALAVLHPAGRIDVQIELVGEGDQAEVRSAALVRTARKIFQGELTLPRYVFPAADDEAEASTARAGAAARRPIRLVVPTAEGGGNDVMARLVAARLAQRLGQEITVDNRPGAGGSIAAEYVAGAAPDGRTLMLGYIGTHALHPALEPLRYDPRTDFEPVGLIGASPTLLVVNPRLDVVSVPQLLDRLRRQPGQCVYADAGRGSPPQFAAELFRQRAGLAALPGLHYRGAAPAIAATANGLAQIMFPSLFTAQPFIRTGALRALAVAGTRRTAQMPELPTLPEVGVEGVDVTQWYALFAPRGTPSAVVEGLSQALREVLSLPDVVARIEAQGAAVKTGGPRELAELVESEFTRWSRVARESGLASEAAGRWLETVE